MDYCTAQQVFDYGNVGTPGTDPVNETALVERLITAVSRAIDARCSQAFSQTVYTNQRLTGTIDRDGVLTVAPPVPTLSTPTAASYRVGGDLTWQTLTLTDVDIEARPHGATVRFLGNDLLAWRFSRISVQLSYTGGYTTATLPEDLRQAAIAATWYEYKRRDAPQDITATPELGIVTVPGEWPPHIKRLLDEHTRVVRS